MSIETPLLPKPKNRDRGRRIRMAVVLSVLTSLVVFQGCDGLFYHPDAQRYRTLASMPNTEDVIFASADGTRLHAWFLRAAGPPKGTVVYFHGNAQNLTSHVSFVDWLPARGFDVFVFDYRGYGQSAGTPSRQGLHEDSLAALEYVRNRPDVDAERMVVLAQSLGGACATAALGEGGAFAVRGLVLDSTFADYIGMGNEVLGGTWVTYPLAWLLLSNRHSPAHSVANIAPTPILFLHSGQDPVVPIGQGRTLHAAAGEPKAFVEIQGRAHPVGARTQADRDRIVDYFMACLGGH